MNNKDAQNYTEEINEILNKIINLEGVIIEICGNWIWVSGNTYINRFALSKAGLHYKRSEKRWYYKPASYVRYGKKKPWSMEKIRNSYGSEKIKTKGFAKIA